MADKKLNKQLKKRLDLSVAVCESVGDAILKFRNFPNYKSLSGAVFKKNDGQLKSPMDAAAESWMRSILKDYYPKEAVLSEEKYEADKTFVCKDSSYWTVDALDGTKSYHYGYKGFCVQMAFVKNNRIQMGVVYAPAFKNTYWAIADNGAYVKHAGKIKRIFTKNRPFSKKIYIDNKTAEGITAKVLKKAGAVKFFESGSYGVKLCRVAEGKADIFLKEGMFKIWDTAPGELILRESGGRLMLWDGKDIDYSGNKIYFKNLCAASVSLHKQVLAFICENLSATYKYAK